MPNLFTIFPSSLSRGVALLMLMLFPLLGRGQTAITPIHTGTMVSFPTWTHTNITQGTASSNDYLQLIAGTSTLISPVLSFTGYSAKQLDFKARTFGAPTTAQSTISISVSVDNGVTYAAAVTRIPGTASLVAVTSVDLSTYSGTQVKVRIQTLGASSSKGVGIDDIAITGTATSTTITTGDPAAGTPVCATSAASISVPFTSAGTFTGAYTVELSTAAGAFPGTALVTTGAASPLTATIPAGTSNGTAYKVRVNNATPATTGSANATAFTIVGTATVAIAPGANQSYVAGAAGTQLTATESFATGTTRVWQVSTTASTGPFADISPAQTGATYTPTFATAGTYYVRASTTFTPCGTVASNVVQVDVSAAPTNTISTPTFATTAVCATAAAPLDVTFTASGAYNATNTFTVQLSDAAGSFAAATTIATLPNNNSTAAQTVSATIPAGTPNGTGYQIQVLASSPATTSLGTSAALTIVGVATVSIAPTATQTILVGASGTALTATESATTTRVWQSAPVSGGPYTTIAGQTGTSYTPTFATAGTYYVVAASTFAACAPVTSNEVQINVTNPLPAITSISPNTAYAGSAGFTLTVNGTNFLAGSTVTFNGVSRVATFTSATKLTVAILAADIAAVGNYNVAVTNAAPGGGTTAATAASSFTVAASPLVYYDFPGNTGDGTANYTLSGNPTVTSTATSVSATRFERFGVTQNTAADRFNSTNWEPGTTANTGKYVGFTFTIAAGYQVALTTLTFTDARSASGPTKYEVRGSTDGFALNSTVLASGTAGAGALTVSLSAVSALQGTYAIRFYAFDKGAGTGTGTYSVDAVSVFGTMTMLPASLSAGTLNPFFALAGSVSAAQSYTLTGVNVSTSTPIDITAPTGFEVSLDGSTYAGGPQSFTPATASFTKTALVRLSNTATGTPGGNITNTNGTQSASVAVTGTVVAEPTAQPTVTATSPASTTIQLALSGGNGARRLVVVRPVGTASAAPVDGLAYAAHAAYGTTTGTNPTTGTNNFVVVADGTTTSVTITGLSANTAYAVEAYAYNDATAANFENYLTANPGTDTFTTVALPATYTWTPGVVDTNWTTATNWAPARLAPNPTDILIFDGAVAPTPTVNVNFPTAGETVAQLQFKNNITATLITAATRTLTIGGNAAGDDFVVGNGSVVTIGTLAAPAALVLSLTALETGSIGGTLVFDGSATASGQHSLLAAAANAVQFLSGSIFRTTAFYDGGAGISPFGAATGNANSVVFRNGSRYEQFGGSNPFGLAAPATAVTFEPLSRFVFAQAANAPALSGRTYGTLEYNTSSPGVSNSTDTGLLTVLGNLIITNGTVGLGLTTAGISLKGDVLVNGGSLAFNPGGTGGGGVVQFNGNTAQVIGGSAAASALTFGTNSSVTINNMAGMTLQRPITLQNGFLLTSGTLSTDATNLLTLGADATVSGGSATSYINGPLARATPAGIASATDYVFPIGKGGNFRALTLSLTGQTAASTYTAEQVEGNPNPSGTNLSPSKDLGSAPLKRVSHVRSFRLTSSNTTTNNATGTVMLSFGVGDRVNNPSDPGLVVAVSTGASAFTNIDRLASTGSATGAGGADVAGTLTSALIATASPAAIFTLGATNDNFGFGQATNPLPVQLSSFSARRQATNAVAVRWTTASEKNSVYFEVQRSFDGRTFGPIAKLLAQGTSTRATAYATTDEQAPAGPLYYRLHQVDTDGQKAYSPVIAVGGDQADIVLYPNPAQTTLHFITAAATAYRVFNPLGQVLLQGTTAAGPATIAVEQLAPGLYHLELQTSTGRAMRKFVKE